MLLHAFPVDARMWNGTRGMLEQQARVITPDQRGLGQSPLDGSATPEPAGQDASPPASERPGLDVAAADVLALLDGLDLPQVVLGGCSMGGYVAMAVLRAAPERVAGLLLADTKAVADTDEQRAGRLAAADRAEREGTAGWLADNSVPGLLGATTRDERPGIVGEVRDLIEAQPASGVAWAQRAMADRPDSADTLRAFTGPALVVVGEQDSLAPPETAVEMAELLPHAERITLPEAGHLSATETPEAFSRAVVSWLDQIT